MSDPVATEVKRYRAGEITRDDLRAALNVWKRYDYHNVMATDNGFAFAHGRGVLTVYERSG